MQRHLILEKGKTNICFPQHNLGAQRYVSAPICFLVYNLGAQRRVFAPVSLPLHNLGAQRYVFAPVFLPRYNLGAQRYVFAPFSFLKYQLDEKRIIKMLGIRRFCSTAVPLPSANVPSGALSPSVHKKGRFQK